MISFVVVVVVIVVVEKLAKNLADDVQTARPAAMPAWPSPPIRHAALPYHSVYIMLAICPLVRTGLQGS